MYMFVKLNGVLFYMIKNKTRNKKKMAYVFKPIQL